MPGQIEQNLQQLVQALSSQGGMSQMIQQHTVAGNAPFANMLIPLMLKQMGIPDVPQINRSFNTQLWQNRDAVISANMWNSNTSFQRVQADMRRTMLTDMFAKGAAKDSPEYARAREYANKTMSVLPEADRIGGLIGLDVGGERLLNQMTKGVGDFESASASIVRATTKRYGASSPRAIRARSEEIMKSLEDDIFDPDEKGIDGERKLRSDFRSRMKGLTLDDFAGTYEVMSREGALDKDNKKAIAQVKDMGEVIQSGKDIFGEDASPEVILAAARELHGSIKSSDAADIKKAFKDVATVLEVTQQSATEYFAKVQEIQDFAKQRGAYMSSKDAGYIVANREMRTQALVNVGVDRTTAAKTANREAETIARIETSGARRDEIAALQASNGDTNLAEQILQGKADGDSMMRYARVRNSFDSDEDGETYKDAAAMQEKSTSAKAWMKERAAKELRKQAAVTLEASGALKPFKIDPYDFAKVSKLYNDVRSADTQEKISSLAKEYGVSGGDIATMRTISGSYSREGDAMRGAEMATKNASGEYTYSANDRIKKARADAHGDFIANARKKANGYNADDYASIHSWITKGEGTNKLDDFIEDMKELSPADNKARKESIQEQLRTLMALKNTSAKDLEEYGITDGGEDATKQITASLEAKGMVMAPEILDKLPKIAPELATAALQSTFKDRKGISGDSFKKSIAVSDAIKNVDKIAESPEGDAIVPAITSNDTTVAQAASPAAPADVKTATDKVVAAGDAVAASIKKAANNIDKVNTTIDATVAANTGTPQQQDATPATDTVAPDTSTWEGRADERAPAAPSSDESFDVNKLSPADRDAYYNSVNKALNDTELDKAKATGAAILKITGGKIDPISDERFKTGSDWNLTREERDAKYAAQLQALRDEQAKTGPARAAEKKAKLDAVMAKRGVRTKEQSDAINSNKFTDETAAILSDDPEAERLRTAQSEAAAAEAKAGEIEAAKHKSAADTLPKEKVSDKFIDKELAEGKVKAVFDSNTLNDEGADAITGAMPKPPPKVKPSDVQPVKLAPAANGAPQQNVANREVHVTVDVNGVTLGKTVAQVQV